MRSEWNEQRGFSSDHGFPSFLLIHSFVWSFRQQTLLGPGHCAEDRG